MDTTRAVVETTSPVGDVLAALQAKRDDLAVRQTQAQQELYACNAQMADLTRRMSAIQVATTALAGLRPLAPEQAWLDGLTAWRKILCDELLALPPRIRDSHMLGVQRNLTLSIRAVDFGLGVIEGTGYDLTTLRLGALMRDAGYAPEGADPDRNYSGVMPWFGSIPEVERRIANIQKERDSSQALLDEALLDVARTERDAAVKRNVATVIPEVGK